MGRGKFDKKQAVRFTLVPGPEKDGKPTVLYKPVESRKSKLSKKQRKNIISELSDYDQIVINGKKINDDEIPAYVLDQIRGRKDIVFNQIRGEEEDLEDEGDLYEIQDGKEDDEYEEYPDYEDLDLEKVEEGRHEDQDNDEEDWQDEDYDSDDEEFVEEQIVEEVKTEKQEKYAHKEEDFPVLEQPEKVEIDGVTYTLTKAQAKLLDTIIPDNYEELDFGGLDFKKYDEYGLPISDKAKNEKYFLKEGEKVVIIDTYDHIPSKPSDFIDNDLKPSQINANKQVKEIEDALEYNGEEPVYEELEDDFFAKMIQDQLTQNAKEKAQISKPAKLKKDVQKVSHTQQAKQVKKAVQVVPKKEEVQRQLEEQLDKALFNFEHNIEQTHKEQSDDEEEDEDDDYSHEQHSMNFTDIEKREDYIGRDGELDWRCLTRKEKKEYMKTKVIRQFYDQLREREIEDKMKGKSNVAPEQLHLKDRIKHITYQQDHVMQKALEQDLKVKVDLDAPSDDSSFSSEQEDDILSFHQKTSIIASNLSVIEEPRKSKAPKLTPTVQEPAEPFTKIKVVPEQRNKNETKEERKERKQKLRAQKKEKKQQKKEFAQKFSKIKKETVRQENPNNPLNKISYIKIY